MKISVVVNTYNRSQTIRATLAGLLQQTLRPSEIVVVNGPSTDNTLEVLSEFSSCIRLESCPEVHLSKSRNIGIDATSGNIIAFIDDDAVPATDWLERISTAYDRPVSGAGGPVYNRGAFNDPWLICTCTRHGDVDVDSRPPYSAYVAAQTDPFLYFPGCNMSFQRSALVKIGGFNEALRYGYEDAEICRELIDHGHDLVYVDDAVVHHAPAANAMRDINGRFQDVSTFLFSRAVFCMQAPSSNRHAIAARFSEVVEYWRQLSNEYVKQQHFDAVTRDQFLIGIKQAVSKGLARGEAPRDRRTFCEL